jgi:spore germination cell wall hydrolase CwlJ-like protein
MKTENFFAAIAFVLTVSVGAAYLTDAPRAEPERGAQVFGLVNLSMEPEQDTQIAKTIKLDTELKKQLDCLAINVYKEAGYEPDRGQIAVAQVTLNRVEHKEFPNTVCGVVYEKTHNRNNGKTICQFSWHCDPVHKNRPVHEASFQKSYQIAEQVFLDGVRLEKLEDALFYHATYINPRWRLEKIKTIGLHTFYRIPERRQYALGQ